MKFIDSLENPEPEIKAIRKIEVEDFPAFIPIGFTEYFDIVKVEEGLKEISIYLEEKLEVESDTRKAQLENKGFSPSALVRDFPLRGKGLLLNIRHRRWIDKETEEYPARLR